MNKTDKDQAVDEIMRRIRLKILKESFMGMCLGAGMSMAILFTIYLVTKG